MWWLCDVDTYIELPALDVFAGILVRNDDDKLRYFTANHPFVELAHDFLNIRLDLVVGRDYLRILISCPQAGVHGLEGCGTEHVQAIFLYAADKCISIDMCLLDRSILWGGVSGQTYAVKSSAG